MNKLYQKYYKIMNIILTGSSGFVGSNVYNYFKDKAKKIICLNREDLTKINSLAFNKYTSDKFNNMDAIIHCAGLAHKPFGKYKYIDVEKININLSINLFKLADIHKIKKFIFISMPSNIDSSEISNPLNEKSTCNPNDDYSKSKYEQKN